MKRLVCYTNHGVTEDFVTVHISALEYVGDFTFAVAFVVNVHDRVVDLRIERFSRFAEHFNVHLFQRFRQLAENQLYAFGKFVRVTVRELCGIL